MDNSPYITFTIIYGIYGFRSRREVVMKFTWKLMGESAKNTVDFPLPRFMTWRSSRQLPQLMHQIRHLQLQ